MTKPSRARSFPYALASGLAMLAATAACSKTKEAAQSSPTPLADARPTSPSTTPAPTDAAATPTTAPSKLAADPAAMPAVAAGDLAFAGALHAELRKRPGNLFFSPASVRIAMAMTAVGARGKTAEELNAGLGLVKDPAESAAGFGAILDSFAQRGKQPNGATVAIANRVWPQAGKRLEPAFVDLLATRFGAPLQALDFAAGSEPARKTINAWVAERTEQKIPELLLPPHISTGTTLVLTNAIYFKAKWTEAFKESATRDATFNVEGGAKAKVRMMATTDRLKYAETATYQAVELPYAGGALAMTIVLPRTGKPLAEVEAAALTAATTAAMGVHRVELQLPKFKLESRFALAETLAKLGMASAFSHGPADFSGIDGTRDLFIGNVIHQAVIAVDESGTEAAAATAVVMTPGAAPPPPEQTKPFIADRPFAFFIRDAATGVVLFVGRLADPSSAGAAK